MKRILTLMALMSPAYAQEISVYDGPNGPVATELRYPNQSFFYTERGMISAPKVGNYTVYNGPNGEYLGGRIDGGDNE
jgi:hypothetical protein